MTLPLAPCPAATGGDAAPVPLCAAPALVERGAGLVFDVLQHGRPARAFALRFEGRVVAYLNRCVHVPTELDWNPGEFLDADRRWILCSIHGAAYEPADGRCVGGPCGRGRLTPLRVAEVDGQVCWYPSPDIRPAPAAPASPAPAPAPDDSSEPP